MRNYSVGMRKYAIHFRVKRQYKNYGGGDGTFEVDFSDHFEAPDDESAIRQAPMEWAKIRARWRKIEEPIVLFLGLEIEHGSFGWKPADANELENSYRTIKR